jgi:SAM-dependent methyltransferase
MEDLKQRYERSRQAWNECASVYEQQIVCGHPDIHAFECFEEDLLDHILIHLCNSQPRPVKLIDVGCGSGRLHLRYGAKALGDRGLEEDHPLHTLRRARPDLTFDSSLQRGMIEVWGIDFSAEMISLAERKVERAALRKGPNLHLSFETGSAFDLSPEPPDALPVSVCLVNSIGVMQGPEGARKLFKAMRRSVEAANGVAIISCYQGEYVRSYGLGQYESTLDVSGQPCWLTPNTHAQDGHRLVARAYKRAYSPSPILVVDAYDTRGQLIEEDVVLERNPGLTDWTIETGKIRTYTDYESHWYSFDQVRQWVREIWPSASQHFETRRLDPLRAEPAQMAILDPGGHLDEPLRRWGLLA